MRNVNVDHIWRTLGPLGKYQCKQIASYLLSLIAWAFQGLNIVFIGHRPDFQCKAGHNDTLMSNVTGIHIEYKQCETVSYVNTSDGVFETSTPCEHGWEYGAPKDQSFVTEWDFVCQNAELGELTQVLYTAGLMLGTFVFPTLSDRYGRKPVMVLSHVISFGISLGMAFSGSYVVFVVLKFLTGFFQQGLLAGTTLCLESVPTEIRHYCAVLGLLSWTSFCALMSPIAYAFRDYPWKYLQITYAMCSSWSILQWWMTDESLRWVIANNQIDRAKEIIKNACKWNKKDYGEVMETIGWGDLVDANSKALAMTNVPESKDVEDVLDAFFRQISGLDYPTRGQRDVIVGSNGADLDPLVQHISSISHANGGQKTEEFDDDEIEVKKYTMFDIFKHKRILIVSMIMWYTWLCDSFVYFGLYLTSSHLYGDRYINFFLSALVEYPSCLLQYFILTRNIGLGVCAFMEKVGSMIAPFTRNVSSKIGWLPPCVFAVMCLITVLLFAFVPETTGVELPQTIEELREWYRVNKFELRIGKNRHTTKETGENDSN